MIAAVNRVLVVDDDADIRASLSDLLEEESIPYLLASSAEEAIGQLASERPRLILSDIRMPGLSGLDLLRIVRERAVGTDVILMTAYDDMPTVVAAMREGASDFLTKPLDLHDLRAVLARVLDDQKTRNSKSQPSSESSGVSPDILVGRDPRMISIYKIVGQVAATATTVLIRGESGTGKELIARAIHRSSMQSDQPFVPVNCTALPSGLLESELFGHVRGSFTGATGDRRGRFALASKGTIFLDEIGDTTLEFQAKLLRVLEDHEFFPVGAERAERTSARVIAATHRDLESFVEQGLFRADLYYRLRVVEIRLPALRDRPADIPLLATHLVRRVCERLAIDAIPVISPEAMQVLVTKQWPGNVRELDNCLTRAVVLTSGGVIRPELLDSFEASPRRTAIVSTLAELERQHLERVLSLTEGNKARAARLLGITRPRLDRLISKHRISSS
jgi:DNA-binding NtrC family response regulator